MNNTIANERKLIKNIDNIIIRYMKMNDNLLESIALENDERFKEEAIKSSSDNFLGDIMDNYQEFTDRLKERIGQLNRVEVEDIKQKKLTEYKMQQKKKKVKTIGVPRKKNRSQPVKGKRQAWNKKEKKIMKRGIRTGLSTSQIRTKINSEREKEGLTPRTYSSVSTKKSRTEKNMRYAYGDE